jgi:hypothetical protein
MTDTITLNAGTGGAVVATDDISSVHYQRIKLIEGADGTNDGDISRANPLPIEANYRLITATAGTMTRPANTTAYAALDAVSNNATAGSVTAISATVSDVNDAPIILHSLLIHTTDTGFKNKTMRVFAYNADPTSSTGIGGGDNAAFATKKGQFIGSFVGTFRGEFSDGAVGTFTPEDAQLVVSTPVSGAATMHFLLETLDAATPSANSTTFITTVRGFQGRA